LFRHKLISIHAVSDLFSNFGGILRIIRLNHNSQSFNQSFFRVVKVWQLNRKVKFIHYSACFCLNSICDINKALVHDKCFLCVFKAQLRESFKNFCYMNVVYFINFDEVFKKHEDQITKKSRLLAVIAILKLRKNWLQNCLKILVVQKYLLRAKTCCTFWYILHTLRQNVCFVCNIQIKFHVSCVGFRYILIHLSLVAYLRFLFRLVRM